MKPYMKKAAILGAVFILMAVSAFIGGNYGFMQGYVYGAGDNGVKAFMLTKTLRELRKGNTTEGISQLESDLDILIMEHWGSSRSAPPLLSWFTRTIKDEPTDQKFFSEVARYRIEYPSTATLPEVRDTITSHLKEFQDQ